MGFVVMGKGEPMTNKDRIENAIRHIKTAADIDPWAMEIAVEAMMKELKNSNEELKNSNGTDINVGSMDEFYTWFMSGAWMR